MEKIIDRAKQYISKSQKGINQTNVFHTDLQNNEEASELIAALTSALEKTRTSDKCIENSAMPPSNRTRTRHNSILSNMGVIREDPHFESMILYDNRPTSEIDVRGIILLLIIFNLKNIIFYTVISILKFNLIIVNYSLGALKIFFYF